jgi:hypothetical protein
VASASSTWWAPSKPTMSVFFLLPSLKRSGEKYRESNPAFSGCYGGLSMVDPTLRLSAGINRSIQIIVPAILAQAFKHVLNLIEYRVKRLIRNLRLLLRTTSSKNKPNGSGHSGPTSSAQALLPNRPIGRERCSPVALQPDSACHSIDEARMVGFVPASMKVSPVPL